MDFFVRLTFGYSSRILPRFQSERRDPVGGLLRTSDPIPQGLQIFIVDRQFPHVLIKIDRMSKALFRLFHAARDARVAGQVECDHGNLGVYRMRPEQNGLHLLDASICLTEYASYSSIAETHRGKRREQLAFTGMDCLRYASK